MIKDRNKSGALVFKPSKTDKDIVSLRQRVSKLERELEELKMILKTSEANKDA